MHQHTHQEVWDPAGGDPSPYAILGRMRNCMSYRGWQHAARRLSQRDHPLGGLNIAEVGCGTGTFSLTFGLMGASTTLIDFNEKVLSSTRRIYELFGCQARFLRADCLAAPPKEIAGTFDLVVSGGLAEHFTGNHRSACIDYHRQLLRDGGMAYIAVPNRLSPFYQWIRLFRRMTGTWGIDVEVAFSPGELKTLAKDVGFRECYVVGNAPLIRDAREYSRGCVSAVIDLFPRSLQRRLRAWKAGLSPRSTTPPDARDEALTHCRALLERLRRNGREEPRMLLADRFSAGVVLFAVK